MFYAVVYEIAGKSSIAVPRPAARPFESAREHVVEMGRLAALYRRRAAALFPMEAEDFFTAAAEITLDETDYRIEAGWSDIDARLLLTREYEKYSLVRLERKYAPLARGAHHRRDALFRRDRLAGSVSRRQRPHQDGQQRRGGHHGKAADRSGAESRLVKAGIVLLDEEYSVHRKTSTYDAYLADWVVDELIGPKPELRRHHARHADRPARVPQGCRARREGVATGERRPQGSPSGGANYLRPGRDVTGNHQATWRGIRGRKHARLVESGTDDQQVVADAVGLARPYRGGPGGAVGAARLRDRVFEGIVARQSDYWEVLSVLGNHYTAVKRYEEGLAVDERPGPPAAARRGGLLQPRLLVFARGKHARGALALWRSRSTSATATFCTSCATATSRRCARAGSSSSCLGRYVKV